MVAEKASDMIKAARQAGDQADPQTLQAFADTESPSIESLAA